MPPRKHPPFPALLLALVVLQPPVPAATTSVDAAGGSSMEEIVGTLLKVTGAVRSGTASLDLLVGCGPALRRIPLTVTPRSRVNGREAEVAFPELHGHPVLAVRFRRVAGRNLALTVDSRPPAGGP